MSIGIPTSRTHGNALFDRYTGSSLVDILSIAVTTTLNLLVVVGVCECPFLNLIPHRRYMILSGVLEIRVITQLLIDDRDLNLHTALNGLHLTGNSSPLIQLPAGPSMNPAICPAVVGCFGHQLDRVILMLDETAHRLCGLSRLYIGSILWVFRLES